MHRTLTTIAGAVAAIAVFAISGEATAERNPDQHINFTQDEVKYTTIDHGYTYIYITCNGKDDPGGWSVSCSSREVGITCGFQEPNSRCSCSSDTPKAHSVKISMVNCR